MRTAVMGLLVCVTLVTYAASLRGGYVYEDIPDRYTRIRFDAWNGWHELRDLPSRPARSLDRALVLLTQRFAGGSPVVARAINLAVHLLNSLLLYLLARLVLSETGALLAMGLWLLHPLMSEGVAYVAGRPDLLAGTWTLLGLLAASTGWPVLALVCAALAITGKEMGIMAIGLVPLWAWCARAPRWPAWTMAAWAAVSLVMAIVFMDGVRASGVAFWSSGVYVAAQLTAFGRLLLLLPEALVHPSALTVDHDWIWITRPIAYGGAALWVVALAGLWRWPLWRFAVLGSLVAMLPRLVLPLADGLHERYLVVPMIGWSLAFGSLYGRKVA